MEGRIDFDGGYADMYESGMVDGAYEISAGIFRDTGKYIATQGWKVDATDYFAHGVPQNVLEHIQHILNTE